MVNIHRWCASRRPNRSKSLNFVSLTRATTALIHTKPTRLRLCSTRKPKRQPKPRIHVCTRTVNWESQKRVDPGIVSIHQAGLGNNLQRKVSSCQVTTSPRPPSLTQRNTHPLLINNGPCPHISSQRGLLQPGLKCQSRHRRLAKAGLTK